MLAVGRMSLLCSLLAIAFAGCKPSPADSVRRPTPPMANYSFGEVIDFGRGGRSDTYKRGGWGDTERDFTWTNGRSARLVFVLPDSSSPLRMRMRLAGFIAPPKLLAQRVEVYVNDEQMADWDVTTMSDFFAIIPADVANHQLFMVELRLPNASSPKVLNVGDDPRTLGVSCFNLDITETTAAVAIEEEEARERRRSEAALGNAYTFGDVIDFGAGGNARRFERSGWYPPEEEFTWTGNDPAVLELTIPPSDRKLVLRLRMGALTAARALPSQPVNIVVNGEEIARFMVSDTKEFEATIPERISRGGGTLRVELKAPRAVSPRALGLNEDPRVLGIRCEAIALSQGDLLEQSPSPSPARSRKPPGRP